MRTLEEVSFATSRIQAVLNDVMFRQQSEFAEQQKCVAAENYTAAAACQSRFTGLLIAENYLREELQNLKHMKAAIHLLPANDNEVVNINAWQERS